MFAMMGTGESDPLPAPLPGENDYWLSNPNIPNEKLLRPKFDKSWTSNKAWHRPLFNRLQDDGPTEHPTAAPVIKNLNFEAFKTKMRLSVYKTLQTRFKNENAEENKRRESQQTDRRDVRKRRVRAPPCPLTRHH